MAKAGGLMGFGVILLAVGGWMVHGGPRGPDLPAGQSIAKVTAANASQPLNVSETGSSGCSCGCGEAASTAQASSGCGDSCGASEAGEAGCVTTPARSGQEVGCGPVALHIACRKLGIKTSPEELAKLAGGKDGQTTMLGLTRAAQAKGIKATGVKLTYDELAHVPMPVVAWLEGGHFVAVLATGKAEVILGRDGEKDQEDVSIKPAEFCRQWKGHVLTFERTSRREGMPEHVSPN